MLNDLSVESKIEFHKCKESEDVYNLIKKADINTFIGFTGPGWYLHIEDDGEWSKINYCPYCGVKLEE